jgi:hypothetical protein
MCERLTKSEARSMLVACLRQFFSSPASARRRILGEADDVLILNDTATGEIDQRARTPLHKKRR